MRVTRRMLVVDDEKNIIFAMKMYFSRRGFEVDSASDPIDAMRLAELNDYCLAIVDLRLGDSDAAEGLEVARRVKQRSETTPVIMLTAHATPDAERRARDIGIESFLRKPRPLPEVAQVAYGLLGAKEEFASL